MMQELRLEWAGVRLWPQEAVNSLENGRCLMERHTGPHPPTHHLKMTLDPFMCLYQTVEVRNSDESLWLGVYTQESRKEGNQLRSAKSGEVRENSCSAAVIYLLEPEFASCHLYCENFQPTENHSRLLWRKKAKTSSSHWGKVCMCECLLLPY